MFRVNYNNESKEVDSQEKVLELVNKIIEENIVDKQLVVIESLDQGVMEIALGMGEDSIVYYLPESEEEDGIVTCNALVARAKTEEVHVSHALGEEVETTTSNIISLDDGLKILQGFLQGEEFIHIVDWYKF